MHGRRQWSLSILLVCALAVAGCTPSDPAAPLAAPDETPSAIDAPGDDELTLPDVLPTGDRPRLPYVSGRDLVSPDGSRLRLALAIRGPWGVTSIVRLRDGYLVTDDRYFEGTLGMQRLDASGRSRDAWSTTGPARLGPSGQVAWLRVPVPEANQTWPATLHVDGRSQELRGHLDPRIVHFDGALVVYSALVVHKGRARSRTFETAVPGAPRRVPRRTEFFVSPRLRHWWRWSDDGLEVGRENAVLVRLDDPALGRAMAEPVWEDERHLLVTVVRGRRQALLRIGVDGDVERATPWSRATPAGHAVLRRITGTKGR
ncbi:hypothetical protein EXE58_12205 [Nocardioides seonyuensis]|uniref:Uncharacterized protein n=1 Tax=Nocardioides seonyuensis TaxID=2518371 RepID=A0A4P7IHH5_9ACTN|nr:hypothetical protein [Nocardioides seonyuensis]QBX56153.1 hypothetical protein EXE58_12205 [Nocardioides seonyuensis]